MIIIGDVHGGGAVAFKHNERTVGMLSADHKKDVYYNIVRGLKQKSIQLGDFGFQKEHEWFLENMDTDQHKVLFGNHDHIPFVNERHSLGHYRFMKEESIMTIRGAYTTDKHNRTEGFDWFPDEELSKEQCEEVIAMMEECKPRIVISHDCPVEVCNAMHGHSFGSRTSQMLQVAFIHHQPDIWVFGHHHRSWTTTLNRTKFVCLAELELFEL